MDALFIGDSEKQKINESSNTKIESKDFHAPDSCMELIHSCHPLIICYFGRKIMTTCDECYDELSNLKIDGDQELLIPLSLTIDILRNKFISSISEGVTNGRMKLYF